MNNFFKNLFLPVITITVISSCGGGGGSGDNPTSPVSPLVPTINFSANPMSVELNNSSTLSWSSTNATSCTALWTSSKETSGSEDVTISIAGNNSFSITCSGSGGSESASVDIEGYRNINGISVDGYISGAEVCIDENENWLCDSIENSTNTNNNGEFTIKYANGNLLSIGGIDLDTQVLLDNLLINHQLSGHTDFKVISPITSIASFLNDPAIVNSLLGIDSSIDIYSFDPVPNKLQSGINDFVYEKGNQLTVLALTLQNIVNNINNSSETSQDFFKSISEELEEEYNFTNEEVDIESASFIEKVLENVISNKNLTVSENSKSNTIAALSNIFPVIKVYSDNEITKAVFNFSISTAQNEIFLITNGTADDSLINFYTNDIYNYIAEDQNIDVNQIKINSSPQITNNIQGFQIDENEFVVGKVNAVDDDGDEIYFSITGTDASLFDISSDGEISFKEAPDYEVPADADSDNIYDFKVSVTDNFSSFNSGYYISKSSDNNARVVVQNIDEDLIFFNLSATNGTENSNPIINVAMQIDSLTLASEAQLLIEYPTITDPDSISWGDGFQQWLYSGVNTNNGINWTITEELPSYVLTGNYKVRELRILRGDLDDIKIIDSIIRDKGFETYVNIDNPNQDIIEPVLESISNFNITGNDGNTSTSINVNFNATVIEDNLSEARVFILYPGGGSKDFVGTINSNNEIIFNVNLDPRTGSGLYKIERLVISDLAGNQSTFNNSDLVNANINNSWELSNTISDDDAPELLSLELEAFFDNNDMSRKNIKVTVATDAQETLIERIYIRLTNEDGSTQIDEEFPSTQYVLSASEYTHTFALPFEYPRGLYTVDYIYIKDKAQNIKQYSLSEIQNNSWDYEVSFDSDNQFIGKVIDGYISGAEIFIDQNFNFNKDAGEYTSYTSSDGSFILDVDDLTTYECLQNRPIIANVPVGAVDSTLGEVIQAYQMILPSISDAGNANIVVSPFTSLFSEAIIGAKSNLSEDLSLVKGCQSEGDQVATAISSRIDELEADIENNFGISYEELLSDFVESPSGLVDEITAQNIAKLLPYLQIIDNQVSEYLTNTFDKDIRANVSLSEDSLSIIFSGTEYEKLPLDFYSIYQTRPNSDGWFRSEILNASGANISKDGILSREHCSNFDTALCNISDLSLENIANTSTSYQKISAFSKNTPIDFADLGITSGFLDVSSQVSSSWRNNSENWNQPNNRSRECQKMESIRFRAGDEGGNESIFTEFTYNNYSQGYEKADCNNVRHYYTPVLTAQTFINNTSVSLEARYYIFDVLRSGISSNLPYDFIDNSVNFNPEIVIKDIVALPRMFKDLNEIRALFRGDDYILFSYGTANGLDAYFEAGTNPSNDMFEDRELGLDRVYGQAARTAFYNKIKEESNFDANWFGEAAPINDSILGRIANSYIEITDYSGTDEINIQVTPKYDPQTQTLDYSIESSIDLENIKDFIENGINGNPLNAKIWFNPDGSIQSTVPIILYLYQGDDTTIDANEGYFKMSFNLTVSSSSSGNTNSYNATQIWSVQEEEEIVVSYTENGTTISQTITNSDLDRIVLTDANTGDEAENLDSYINQPASLNLKLLNLISKVSDKIDGIQNFFTDGGEYTVRLDLGSGGHSLIGFNRDIVKNITGTFTTRSNPEYAITVNDMIIREGQSGNSKNICFNRPSNGDLSATDFNISFTQRERPGKGGFADDFTLSKTKIEFAENDIQSCTLFTAIKDTHFDWAHDIYLDISEPSNGQKLSRSRIKITILDSFYPNRIDWRRK